MAAQKSQLMTLGGMHILEDGSEVKSDGTKSVDVNKYRELP